MADSQFDKFLATPTSTKVAVIVLLMGLLGAAWYFLFYGEVEAALGKERKKTPQLNKALAEEQEIEKNLKKYRDEIERLRKARDEMRDRLPEKPDVADLLQQIHSQAKVVGLDIMRFQRSDDEPEANYVRIPVKMELQGTFHQVATFFFYVGKLTRIVNVENIQLAALDRKDGEERVLARCDASTFMYSPPPEKPAKKGKKGKKGSKGKKGGKG